MGDNESPRHTAALTEKELTKTNRTLVRALARRAAALKRLRAADEAVREARRHLRLVLQGVIVEPYLSAPVQGPDLEPIYADLSRGEELPPA